LLGEGDCGFCAQIAQIAHELIGAQNSFLMWFGQDLDVFKGIVNIYDTEDDDHRVPISMLPTANR